MTWSPALQVQPQRIELETSAVKVSHWPIVGLDDLVQLGELHLLVFHVVGAEIIGEVELRRGFRLHAYLAAVEVQRRVDLARRGSMKPSPS
jgi:hypothetical protein